MDIDEVEDKIVQVCNPWTTRYRKFDKLKLSTVYNYKKNKFKNGYMMFLRSDKFSENRGSQIPRGRCPDRNSLFYNYNFQCGMDINRRQTDKTQRLID